jgi:hypothetical protein
MGQIKSAGGARGADLDWDQVVTYTLTQATQALTEIHSATQP